MKLNMLIGTLVLGTTFCAPSFAGGLLDRMLGLKGSGCDSSCCDTGCAVDPSCGCEIASCGGGCEPTCGVEMSACGGCGSSDPSCGCEIAACDPCGSAAPSCGCEISACDPCGSTCKPRRKPLLELLGKVRCKQKALVSHLMSPKCGGCDTGCAAPSCGCEVADPTCGCEISSCDPCGAAAPSCGCEMSAGCDSGCGTKKCGGLLSKLFQRKNSCCDAIACDSGCSSCSSCGTSAPAPISAPAVHGDAAPMPPAPIVDPSAYLQSNRRVIQATSYVR